MVNSHGRATSLTQRQSEYQLPAPEVCESSRSTMGLTTRSGELSSSGSALIVLEDLNAKVGEILATQRLAAWPS